MNKSHNRDNNTITNGTGTKTTTSSAEHRPKAPAWIRQSIIQQIFPTHHHNNNNKQEEENDESDIPIIGPDFSNARVILRRTSTSIRPLSTSQKQTLNRENDRSQRGEGNQSNIRSIHHHHRLSNRGGKGRRIMSSSSSAAAAARERFDTNGSTETVSTTTTLSSPSSWHHRPALVWERINLHHQTTTTTTLTTTHDEKGHKTPRRRNASTGYNTTNTNNADERQSLYGRFKGRLSKDSSCKNNSRISSKGRSLYSWTSRHRRRSSLDNSAVQTATTSNDEAYSPGRTRLSHHHIQSNANSNSICPLDVWTLLSESEKIAYIQEQQGDNAVSTLMGDDTTRHRPPSSWRPPPASKIFTTGSLQSSSWSEEFMKDHDEASSLSLQSSNGDNGNTRVY